MFSIDPVERLSRTSASWPSSSSRSARCEPMKPAPPVRNAFKRLLTPRSQRGDLRRGRWHVVMHVGPVELHRAPQSVAKRGRWPPPDSSHDERGIGVEVADVDCLLLRRPFDAAPPAGARGRYQQLDQVAVRNRLEAADVQRLAVRRVGGAGAQKRLGRIIDEDEVAQLAAVAVDLDFAVLERQSDEPGDEALAIVLDQL